MYSRMKLTALVGAAALAIACGTTVETSQDEAASAGGGGGGPGPNPGPDLFACPTPYEHCSLDYGHLGESLTDEAVRCVGQLLATGEPGAVFGTSQPGPYPMESEFRSVLLGNGKVLQQNRWRCMTEDGCADQATTQWTLSPLELCDVQVDPEAIAGCGDPDGTCEWSGYAVNCVPAVESWTCEELP